MTDNKRPDSFVTVVARDPDTDSIILFDLKNVPDGEAMQLAAEACAREKVAYISCHRAQNRGGLRFGVKGSS